MGWVLSKRLYKATDNSLWFWCPGCRHIHAVQVASPGQAGPVWGWNGSADAPTFTPSILVRGGHYVPGQPQPPHCAMCNNPEPELGVGCVICHSFVTNGEIRFLEDCTHPLAGQTVPIPPLPDYLVKRQQPQG